jgi:predicted O-methyltransferase YrrM
MKPEEVMESIEVEASLRGLPIIGPRRGALLDETIERHRPSTVLEVGTNVGYSAIRMGRLLEKGGKVTCVELDEHLARVARTNIAKAGLANRIQVIVGDAKQVLPALRGTFDMVFLDAVKDEYFTYLRECERMLHPGSVVVADNVKSHSSEVVNYLEYVRSSGRYKSDYVEAPPNYGSDSGDAVEVSVRL